MANEKEKFEALARVSMDLVRVQDLDMTMEHILTEARRFVNADAGSIYIMDRKQGVLQFSHTQNDTLQHRLPKGKKLIYSYFTLPVNEQTIAGYVASTGQLMNIEDVYRIDPQRPYAFNAKFDKLSDYRTVSMLTLPLANNRGRILGVLQVINAKNEAGDIIPFSHEDLTIMQAYAAYASVALELAEMAHNTYMRQAAIAEMRDPKETGAHVLRVKEYAKAIYERWAFERGYSRDIIDRYRDILSPGAILHDIGKVGIRDQVLKKPGKLDADEYDEMKTHTILGARQFMGFTDPQATVEDPRMKKEFDEATRQGDLDEAALPPEVSLNERQQKYEKTAFNSDYDKAAFQVAMNHHERWDGTGYPRGIGGTDIPLFGRIVAIADVYDALCSKRVYKDEMPEEQVIGIIQKDAGTHFDPQLVDVFLGLTDQMRSIRTRYKDAVPEVD